MHTLSVRCNWKIHLKLSIEKVSVFPKTRFCHKNCHTLSFYILTYYVSINFTSIARECTCVEFTDLEIIMHYWLLVLQYNKTIYIHKLQNLIINCRPFMPSVLGSFQLPKKRKWLSISIRTYGLAFARRLLCP